MIFFLLIIQKKISLQQSYLFHLDLLYNYTIIHCTYKHSQWYQIQITCVILILVRRGIITYPKSLSGIRNSFPKVVSDFRRKYFGYQNLPCNYICMSEIRRISQVNVSDIVSDIWKKCSYMLWRFALDKLFRSTERPLNAFHSMTESFVIILHRGTPDFQCDLQWQTYGEWNATYGDYFNMYWSFESHFMCFYNA